MVLLSYCMRADFEINKAHLDSLNYTRHQISLLHTPPKMAITSKRPLSISDDNAPPASKKARQELSPTSTPILAPTVIASPSTLVGSVAPAAATTPAQPTPTEETDAATSAESSSSESSEASGSEAESSEKSNSKAESADESKSGSESEPEFKLELFSSDYESEVDTVNSIPDSQRDHNRLSPAHSSWPPGSGESQTSDYTPSNSDNDPPSESEPVEQPASSSSSSHRHTNEALPRPASDSPDPAPEATTRPLTAENLGRLQRRLDNLLPRLQYANEQLERFRHEANIEGVEEGEAHIEMDLGLGVLEEKGDGEAEDSKNEDDTGDAGVAEGSAPKEEEGVMEKLLGKSETEGGGTVNIEEVEDD